MDPGKQIEIVHILGAQGVKRIEVSGGEPMLIPGLPEIVRLCKDTYQMDIGLSTNAKVLAQSEVRRHQVLPYLQSVGIPLESMDASVHNQLRAGRFRAEDNYHDVLKLMRLLRDEFPKLWTKLGTVVCRANAYDVQEIAEAIRNQAIPTPNSWKLYQYRNTGGGENLQISTEEFNVIASNAQDVLHDVDLKIVIQDDATFNKTHFFIFPDGYLGYCEDGVNRELGSIFTDLEFIQLAWRNYIDENTLVKNVLQTYYGL